MKMKKAVVALVALLFIGSFIGGYAVGGHAPTNTTNCTETISHLTYDYLPSAQNSPQAVAWSQDVKTVCK